MPSPGYELRQLRTFATVAQRRSFTRAADDLHIAQQAVSQQIKARPLPARSELAGDALRRSITGIRRGVRKIAHPRRALAPAGTLFRQARQLGREGRAPSTSFNRPVGGQHRVLLVRAGLDQAKQVAHAHHATVNDVVLCTIADGHGDEQDADQIPRLCCARRGADRCGHRDLQHESGGGARRGPPAARVPRRRWCTAPRR